MDAYFKVQSSNNQAHREPQRGPGNHYHGPYHNLIPWTPRSIESVDREETWGRVSSHHSTRGLGGDVSSPSGVRSEPRPKTDFIHISGQTEAIWNALFIIFELRGPPKRCGARENSPSRRACQQCHHLYCHLTVQTFWSVSSVTNGQF